MVIGNGKLLYDGGLEALKHTYAPLRRLKVVSPNLPVEIAVEGAESVQRNGDACAILFDPAVCPPYVMMERVIGFMRENAALITDMVIQEQDIDEIIATMYREMNL
jgi:ABC-type uncharacterized transport system ATPase subunit